MDNSNYLYFNSDPINIRGIIKFSVLPKVVDQLRVKGYSPEAVFLNITSLNSLLITYYKGKEGSFRYKLHTTHGVFPFKQSDDGGDFLLMGFNESSFVDTNKALMYGMRFAGTSGTVIMVRLRASNWFAAYANGRKYDANDYNSVSGQEAIFAIKASCSSDRIEDKPANVNNENEPSPGLLKLLDLAENYSILANDLENKKAEELGQVSYQGYESVDYPRRDRIAYRFLIEKQKQQVFSAGTNVDILNSSGDVAHTAEIVDVKTKGPNDYLTMLFTKELDLKELPQMGWLRLSVSTVNMDVQLGAIIKIRQGRAKAKYFNSVLGEKKPQGFFNEDLNNLGNELAKKKYPPNASQFKAIKNGINTKDVYLVMGPPGTGKTTVILEWVKYFVKEKGLRVLVSSQNNKAVDNVLERLAEEKGIDTIRIGSEAKVQEGVIPFIFENKLVTLREKISDHANETIQEVRKALREWLDYATLLRDHLRRIAKYEENKLKSRIYINRHIDSLYNKLIELKSENSSIINQIDQLKNEHKDMLSRKKKYESSNIFLRALSYLQMQSVWASLELYNKNITDLVLKQNSIASSYNDIYSKLKNSYAYFNNKILGIYYGSYSAAVDSVNNISGSAPIKYADLSLFRRLDLDETQLINAEEVQAYYNYVRVECKRAQALIKIVDSWKNEIEASQNYALHQIVLDSVDLVGATCIGVSSQKRFQDLDFDVTIIDEAGQIQLHNAFVPMSVSNKVIMLGDHMQIPPNADQDLVALCEDNDVDPELLGKSLFEKMYYELPDSNKTLLDTQYRMPAEIADIISGWFYDGEYLSPDFLRATKPAVPSLSEKNLILVDTPPAKKGENELKDPEGGYNNPVEADAIRKIVKHILKTTDIDEKQIGIISAYKSQVKLIKRELKEDVGSTSLDEMVASLDSFQGQERDIIIYSFTRSSKRKATQSRIGFLNELRRLNVAMSRCKKILIMIGDFNYLSNCKKDDADHPIYAKDGKRVVNGSEAVFSEFIRVMCSGVKKGKGEMIDVPALIKRIEG